MVKVFFNNFPILILIYFIFPSRLIDYIEINIVIKFKVYRFNKIKSTNETAIRVIKNSNANLE